MNPPRWIDKTALTLLHAESLAEHGGVEGLREDGPLKSTLARPRNLHAYESIDDPARLAVAYAAGIARNHPFADGNKRTAFLALGVFLALNGFRLTAGKADATRAMLMLVAGEIGEEELAGWVRANLAPRR